MNIVSCDSLSWNTCVSRFLPSFLCFLFILIIWYHMIDSPFSFLLPLHGRYGQFQIYLKLHVDDSLLISGSKNSRSKHLRVFSTRTIASFQSWSTLKRKAATSSAVMKVWSISFSFIMQPAPSCLVLSTGIWGQGWGFSSSWTRQSIWESCVTRMHSTGLIKCPPSLPFADLS